MNNFGPQFPQQAYVYRPTGNRVAIKWLVAIIGIFFALLAGFTTLNTIGDETGTAALMTGILTAMLPIPIYILLILWIDRYESEPLWMLAAAFFWGATVAAFIAIEINSYIFFALAQSYDRFTGMYYALVYSAPIVEESSKAIILFIFFWWKKDEFDGVVDGIVYAGMVGVFFAIYFLVMIPIFSGAIVAIVFALKREGRIVRENLWHDCQRGLFTPAEYFRLCSIRGRMGASFNALKWGGFRLWRARMKYNQLASELAFHRSRVQLGMITDPHAAYEREMAYVNQLFELRRQLGYF